MIITSNVYFRQKLSCQIVIFFKYFKIKIKIKSNNNNNNKLPSEFNCSRKSYIIIPVSILKKIPEKINPTTIQIVTPPQSKPIWYQQKLYWDHTSYTTTLNHVPYLWPSHYKEPLRVIHLKRFIIQKLREWLQFSQIKLFRNIGTDKPFPEKESVLEKSDPGRKKKRSSHSFINGPSLSSCIIFTTNITLNIGREVSQACKRCGGRIFAGRIHFCHGNHSVCENYCTLDRIFWHWRRVVYRTLFPFIFLVYCVITCKLQTVLIVEDVKI